MPVEFKDNSINVKASLNNANIQWLYEAAGEVEAQTKQNTRVNSGQLKNSWSYKVDESKGEATIGSPLENAIWEEFGTGEYALNGDGRKGGWYYQDSKDGTWKHTYGKYPHRALQSAFNSLRKPLVARFQEIMKGLK